MGIQTQPLILPRRVAGPKRLLGRLYWTLAVTAFILVTGYFLVSWLLEPLIERELRDRLGGAVYLDSVRWMSPGQVRLSDLLIAARPEDLAQNPLARIGRIDCRLSFRSLLRFKVNILALTVREANFLGEYDFDQSRWNFADLQFVRGGGDGGETRIPIVYLRDSRLQVRTRRQRQVEILTTVGLEGQFVSYREGREYRFELNTNPDLALADSGIKGVWRRGKDQGQIVLDGTVRMPRRQIYGNAWNVRDIRLDCEYSPRQTRLNELSFALGESRAALQGVLAASESDSPMDLHVRFDNMAFGPSFQKDTVVYSPPVLNLIDPGFAGFLKRFAPVGRGDLDVQLTGRLSAPGTYRADGVFYCRDVTITDRKLPYAMEHLSGKVLLEKERLAFDSLRARHGEATFVIQGGVEHNGSRSYLHSIVTGTGLAFNEDLYRALPPDYKRLWFAFAPSGTGNIEYEFQQFPDRPSLERLRVDLVSARAVFDRFPYPLENLTGTLIFEPNRIECRNLTSRYADSQTIVVNGRLQNPNDPRPRFSFDVQANNLPVDNTLRRAFPKARRDLIDEFAIRGAVDARLQVVDTDQPDKEAEFTGSVQLTADSLMWKPLPLPLANARIEARLQPDRVEVVMPAAGYGDGTLEGSAALRFADGAEKPSGSVSFSGHNIPLDDALWEAIGKRVSLPAPWSSLRADGTVDLSGQLSLDTPRAALPQMTVTCHGNRLYTTDHMWVTGPATGTLQLDGPQITVENFAVEEVPIDRYAAGLLPPSMRAPLEALDAQGRLDVQVRNGRLALEPDNQFTAQADGTVDFEKVGLPSLQIDGVCGRVLGQLAYSSRTGFPEGKGTFEVARARVLNRPILNLAGPWTASPSSRRATVPDFSADCGGGRIFGNAEADFSDPAAPPRFELHTWFSQVQVASLLEPEETGEQEKKRAKGFLQGAFSARGPLGDPQAVTGRLQLKATELEIESETMLGKTMTLMGLQKPTDYVFEEMSLQADLEKKVFHCPRVLLEGKNSVFQGSGQVDLAAQTIQMDLTAFGRRAGHKPTLINTLAENIGAALARVEISGDLRNPEIRKIPLPLFRLPFLLLGTPLNDDSERP